MRRVVYPIILGLVLIAGGLLASEYLYDRGSDWTTKEPQNSATLVARGSYLVRAGDCIACHTVRGGADYAGGRKILTPFGSLYSPNITPDQATGIGSWTSNDFWRALHNGKSKDGHFLYPAFPYPNYTIVTRADSDAMFAYLKTVPGSKQVNRQHELNFPYNYQVVLAGWRILFFRPAVYQTDHHQSAEWNRGAYLVNGLGHCAVCHTPYNTFGAPENHANLAGGLIPIIDWYAPSLTSNNESGLGSWANEDIAALLKTGISPRSSVFGPMSSVVRDSLQYLSSDDIGAMATYLKSLPQTVTQSDEHQLPFDEGSRQTTLKLGAKLYGDYCAGCHKQNGQGMPPAYPPLAGNRAINMASSVDTIRMILNGGFPPGTAGNPRPYSMPPYQPVLSDIEIAAVASYIRQSWGNTASLVSPQTVNQYRAVPVE